MKITLLTESLSSGGAERQICTLAVEMKRRGLDVCVMTYRPGDFYLPVLVEAGVSHRLLQGKGRLGRILAVRRALRSEPHDVVLSFMRGASSYAGFAAWPRRDWGLVVSERLAIPGSHRHRFDWKRRLFVYADCVTTNSHTNRLMIERSVPRLAGRVVTVYNSVDLDAFKPGKESSSRSSRLRLVVGASYQAKKNMLGLIEAAALLKRESPGVDLAVDWYGTIPADRTPYEDARQRIRQLGLQEQFRLNPATRNIVNEYQAADAVVLPSFYEGLPNTICEGMACGCPILMSAVCDAGNLVKEGENGFLFDPASPESIAQSIRKFISLSSAQRVSFGNRSREMAEQMFDVKRVAAKYIDILTAAAKRRCTQFDHWVPDTPDTARSSLD